MPSKPYRVYADTSVYGEIEDDEFAGANRSFFEQVGADRFHLVVSAVVAEELELATESVRAHFDELLPRAEIIGMSSDQQQEYWRRRTADLRARKAVVQRRQAE